MREQDRRIGQQGNELGNLRSTFEALSKAQSVPVEPEPEPVEEADFFVDPQKAVDQRIHNHPALKEARENGTETRLRAVSCHSATTPS